MLAAGLRCQGGQVQPDRPPLGPTGQLGHLGVGQPDPGTLQQRPGLLLVHGQLVDPELHHLALGPQQGHRQGWCAPGRQHQLGAFREPHSQLGHRVKALPALQQFHVIQDHGHRLGHRRNSGRQPRYHRGEGRGAREGQGLEHVRVDWLDPVQRDRNVGQQDHRVVVGPIDRDPGDPAPFPLGPLGQQSGLAVAGRGHHAHERGGLGGKQVLDHRGPGHDSRTSRRRMELGLHQLKGWPHPGPHAALGNPYNTLLLARLHSKWVARRVCPAQRESGRPSTPGPSQAEGGISFCWDDADRLLVMLPCSEQRFASPSAGSRGDHRDT